ncbi:MAG: mannose-1-phosphate guanylyltransferase [Planctomycetaceae bacterium]
MAGGSGTRFWPQSRHQMPKQLLRLAGDRTMIQQTVDRSTGWASPECTWIVTNHLQAAKTAEQLPELPIGNILVEPAARNTAPCVGLAAIQILHNDPEGIMFVMPADHVIQPAEAFDAAARQAIQIVESQPDRLVLFGVAPTFPSTGYGYIERSSMIPGSSPPVFDVKSFREKPQLETAEDYLRAGTFYWNCGIFCWKAQTIVDCLAEFEPEVHDRLQRIAESLRNGNSEQVIADEFPQMKSISIDYAVLERAKGVTVIEAPFQWDDVGSWLAVPRLIGVDAHGNAVDGPFCGIDTHNCIVRSTDDHLIATLGAKNLIIVHTPDATLVADVEQSERIKEVLAKLSEEGKSEFL